MKLNSIHWPIEMKYEPSLYNEIMNNQYDQKEKKNNRSMTFCSLDLGHTHYILLKTQMCFLYMTMKRTLDLRKHILLGTSKDIIAHIALLVF